VTLGKVACFEAVDHRSAATSASGAQHADRFRDRISPTLSAADSRRCR